MSKFFPAEAGDKPRLSAEYYAFKLGKEYYRSPHREKLFIGLRKLEAKSGVAMATLLKEAREGYAMARAMHAKKNGGRSPVSSHLASMSAGYAKHAPAVRRHGHKHGPSKSGRKCPKCGV